jgi:peroxiredoxin
MKKILIIISVFQLIIIAAKANIVVVNAQIKNLPAGKWIFYREQGGNDAMDSVKSFAGGFKFKIDIADGEGNLYLISVERNYQDPNSYTEIFLDKGIVNITGDGPLLKGAKFSGTPSAVQLNDYNNYMQSNEQIKSESEIYKQASDYYHAGDTANLKLAEQKIDAIDSIKTQMQKQWIRKHTTSPVSAYILEYMRFSVNFDTLEVLYNYLTATAKNNYPAKNLKHAIEVNKLTGIGKTALDFTQPDTLGKPVSLKDFRGKYVLLDFWASWCGPCREENPNVVAAFNKYKDKNFTILSVSLDQPTGKEKWLNAIHKDGLTWTHVSDLKFWSNAVAKEYDIEGIPANFLIDPNGVIIAKNLRGDDLNNKLAEVLK